MATQNDADGHDTAELGPPLPEPTVCGLDHADPFHVVAVRHEVPCNRGRVRDPPLRAVAAVR